MLRNSHRAQLADALGQSGSKMQKQIQTNEHLRLDDYGSGTSDGGAISPNAL